MSGHHNDRSAQPEVVWSKSFEGVGHLLANRDTLALTCNCGTHVLDAGSGEERYRIPKEWPFHLDDDVLLTYKNNAGFAYDIGTGKRIYRINLPLSPRHNPPPFVADDFLVVAGEDGIEAFRRSNTRARPVKAWRRPWNKRAPYWPVITMSAKILFVSEPPYILALNAETGELRWRTRGRSAIPDSKSVLVTNERDRLALHNLSDGRPIWERDVETSGIFCFAHGMLVLRRVVRGHWEIAILDRATGADRAVIAKNAGAFAAVSGVFYLYDGASGVDATADGRFPRPANLLSGRHILAFGPDGRRLWAMPIKSVLSAPVVMFAPFRRGLFVLDEDRTIIKLVAKTRPTSKKILRARR